MIFLKILIKLRLKYILFPNETPLHDYMIERTPWHLCNSKESEVRGFSGTNDTRFLLPLHVKQQLSDEIEDNELKSASGKMITLMLENKKYEIISSQSPKCNDPMWKKLIEKAIKLNLDALIDTGALLAGVTNIEAANFILNKLKNEKYKGVIYFDISLKSWMVKNQTGQCWYLKNSPIQACDCFTIFDENRCRGADISLKPEAIGLVTLGPRMTKDKLMQGLGRLRMLDRSQRVIFIGGEDVTKSICQSNGISINDWRVEDITSKEILKCVVLNTLEFIQESLLDWGSQGAHYYLSNRENKQILMKEENSCEKLYSEVNYETSLINIYEKKINQLKNSFENNIDMNKNIEDYEELLNNIRNKIIGYSVKVSKTISFGEECEKELEIHQEVEIEHEKEIEKMEAFGEIDWKYNSIFEELPPEIYPLKCIERFIESKLQKENVIKWSKNIYFTKNFLFTIKRKNEMEKLNNYLRPVDFILYWDSKIILISEREMNSLLPLFWKKCSENSISNSNSIQQHSINLTNFSYLKDIDGELNSTNLKEIPLCLSVESNNLFKYY